MRMRLVGIVLALLLCRTATADLVYPGLALSLRPAPPPPVTASWKLLKGEQFVEFITPRIGDPNFPVEPQFQITPINAAQFGVDFPAWQMALNDPGYDRSIIRYGDVMREFPFSNPGPAFKLDVLYLYMRHGGGGGAADLSVDVTYGVIQRVAVPEPTTAALVALACGLFFNRRSNRGIGR